MKVHNLAEISEAHNHRWNFSTRIISGGYLHTIYRMDLLDTESIPVIQIGVSEILRFNHIHSKS